MAILSKDEAQAILKKVLSFSTADECAGQPERAHHRQRALRPQLA